MSDNTQSVMDQKNREISSESVTTSLTTDYTYSDQVVQMQNNGMKISCLLVTLFIFGAIFLVSLAALASVFYLSSTVVVELQANINYTTNLVNNVTRMLINIQYLESTMNSRVSELNDQLTGKVDILKIETSEVASVIAAKLSLVSGTINETAQKVSSNNEIIGNITTESISVKNRTRFFFNHSIASGHAFNSCAVIWQLYPSAHSGYYNIRLPNGSAINVYCAINDACERAAGVWMRVVKIDIGGNTNQCPGDGLILNIAPTKSCFKRSSLYGCSSSTFSVKGIRYSKVCGKIIASKVGSPNAFGDGNPNINSNYVDGVSITHGQSPRKHIWTFVAASNEDSTNPAFNCPCINTEISSMVPPTPSFVGDDYFCATARALWNGKRCGRNDECCTFNNPPWFFRQLSRPTTDDIEMRVCDVENGRTKGLGIKGIELYIS